MQLSEQQRATAAASIADDLVDVIAKRVNAADGDEGDMASIAVIACVTVALSFASTRADRAAALALVNCLAGAIADDIFGPAR